PAQGQPAPAAPAADAAAAPPAAGEANAQGPARPGRPGRPPAVQPLLQQGVDALQAGDPAAALTPLRQAYELAPNDPEVLYFLGLAALEAGQVPAASVIFRQLLEFPEAEAEAAYQLGRIAFALERVEIAGYWFDRALATATNDAIREQARTGLRQAALAAGLEIEQSAPRLLQVGFGFDDNIVRLRDTVNPLALNEEDLFTEFLLSGQDKLDAEGTWRSDVALLGRSYANSRAADDYTALGGLTRTVELNEDWLALPRVSQSFSYIGDDAYLSTSAARLQLASSRWRLYYEGAWLASLSEIFDGYEGHRHQLSATRLWRTGDAAYGAGYTYEYNDRELDLLSPQRHRLLLSSEFVLDAERSIEGVLRYTFSDYEADREDNELQGTLRLNRRLTRDLILLTEYRYVRYDSSIDFIDYRQNVFYTALVTEF
ncbi:MAG TPA: tetratricopeptide repeat protein, partial [Gammaproteobacteria bacterium]|nr:tetratricopeptide repeat protein [Gammaproteobacteria bacterium]